MPDEELGQQDAGAPASEPSGSDTQATPTTPDAPQADPWDSGADTFPRSYVEKLRGENATYRQTYQPWERASQGLHPEDSQALQGLMQMMAQGDPEAARLLYEYAEAYGEAVGYQPQQQQPQYEQMPDGSYFDPNDPNRPMTLGEFQAMQEYQHNEAAVAQVDAAARELGFDPAQDWTGYVDVLRRAYANGGDINAAAAEISAERESQSQQAVDAYLAKKRQEAGGTVAPSDGGSPTGGKQPPKSMDEVWAAVESKMEAMADQ